MVQAASLNQQRKRVKNDLYHHPPLNPLPERGEEKGVKHPVEGREI